MTVDQLIEDIVGREGAWADNPRDRGGPTAWGISCWTWARRNKIRSPAYPRSVDALNSPKVQAFFARMRPVMSAVTRGQANEVYKDTFFYRPGFDKLPAEFQDHVTDIGVTSGPSLAVTMLQQVLNATGSKLAEDGQLGPATLAALAETVEMAGAELVNDALAIERARFFVSLNEPTFTNGWLNRAAEFASAEAARTIKAMKHG